jgi:hypothetical protein
MEITNDIIKKQIIEILEETFERSHGIYLDKKTSLLETIDSIPFEKVGKNFYGIPETIAGHINHVIFYIVVLKEYITGKRTGKTDWNESWKVIDVTEEEWEGLKNRLQEEYASLKNLVEDIDQWENEDYLGGSIAIIAHCAFHLGIIRQLKDF